MGCACTNIKTIRKKNFLVEDLFPSPTPSPSPSYESRTVYTYEDREQCGYQKDHKEYQCALTCPDCNLCHKSENFIQSNYSDRCNEVKEANMKELCEFLAGRVKHVKDKCIFPKDITNLIINDRECYSFYTKGSDRYYINDIIYFKIKTKKKAKKLSLLRKT